MGSSSILRSPFFPSISHAAWQYLGEGGNPFNRGSSSPDFYFFAPYNLCTSLLPNVSNSHQLVAGFENKIQGHLIGGDEGCRRWWFEDGFLETCIVWDRPLLNTNCLGWERTMGLAWPWKLLLGKRKVRLKARFGPRGDDQLRCFILIKGWRKRGGRNSFVDKQRFANEEQVSPNQG